MNSFHYKNLLFSISSKLAVKSCSQQFEIQSLRIHHFSDEISTTLLSNQLTIFEVSLGNYQCLINYDISQHMSKKVFIIPLTILLATGVVAVLVFMVREDRSEPVDKEIQPPSDQPYLNWKTWRSVDYGPDCDLEPHCYDPQSYNLGIEFKYPPEFMPLGYRDKGGGLWFSFNTTDNSNDSIAIDCTIQAQSELVEWLYPRAFEYHKYTLLDKKEIEIGGFQGIEAIFEVTGNSPAVSHWQFVDRLIQFSITGLDKVCEIQAPLTLDRNIVEKIISSFTVSF